MKPIIKEINEEIDLCEKYLNEVNIFTDKTNIERLALKIAGSCSQTLSALKNLIEEDAWKSVEEDMPPEYDTIFAKLKGTSKWREGMFEKASMPVIVVAELGGHYRTMIGKTLDGVWKTDPQIHNPVAKVIYWKPMSTFDPSEVMNE